MASGTFLNLFKYSRQKNQNVLRGQSLDRGCVSLVAQDTLQPYASQQAPTFDREDRGLEEQSPFPHADCARVARYTGFIHTVLVCSGTRPGECNSKPYIPNRCNFRTEFLTDDQQGAKEALAFAERVATWKSGPEALILTLPDILPKDLYAWFSAAACTGLANSPLEDLKKGNNMYESGRIISINVGKIGKV